MPLVASLTGNNYRPKRKLPITVEALIVGGGGGGGGSIANNVFGAGGGGAGGYRFITGISVQQGNYTATVGGGGPGGNATRGTSGTASSIFGFSSAGGGGGGSSASGLGAGVSGGSGGGSYLTNAAGVGNTPATTPSQGSAGGIGSGGTAPTATVTTVTNTLSGPFLNTVANVTSGNLDDGWVTFTLPFTITYLGVNYTQFHVGTNSWITFGSGSSVFQNISATNPNLPKIFVSAADNRLNSLTWQINGVSPLRSLSLRWEGRNSNGQGQSNMFWEATFYESDPAKITLQVGLNARGTGGLSGVYSNNQLLASFPDADIQEFGVDIVTGIADVNGGGGGGGGATSAGSSANSSIGANGGSGATIFGTTYSAGGRGGDRNGTIGKQNGSSASVNTGNGGGGATGGLAGSLTATGGAGGSGRVIVRYLGAPQATGGVVIEDAGYTYHVFNSTDTFSY